MKTPKEYIDNLKKGVITEDMFSDCLFSLNKRAKNYRDKAREQRNEYGKYAITENNDVKKAYYYKLKELLLKLLVPVCIHCEFAGYERRRIYDYEPDYAKYRNRFVWENHFYSSEAGYEVWFGDIELTDKPRYRYYFYYKLGSHSYHKPIDESMAYKHSELEVKEVKEIVTYGKDIGQLLSMNFVNKVFDLLETGNYTLAFNEHANPLPKISRSAITDANGKKLPEAVAVRKPEKSVPPAEKVETIATYRRGEQTIAEFLAPIVRHYASKEDVIQYAMNHGMQTTKKTLQRDALTYVVDSGLAFSFAKAFEIGVEKVNYIEAGMSERDYRRLYKKFRKVGTRETEGRYKAVVNEYDIEQYLNWRNTGKIE